MIFIRTIIKEHVGLNLSYIDHQSHEIGEKTTLMIFMVITNKSRLPISLSSAFLELNGNRYSFDWRPQEVLRETTRRGNEIIDQRTTHSIAMPQTLMGLGVIGGYFAVSTDLSKQFLEVNPSCNVILHTNKKILRFPITLSKKE